MKAFKISLLLAFSVLLIFCSSSKAENYRISGNIKVIVPVFDYYEQQKAFEIFFDGLKTYNWKFMDAYFNVLNKSNDVFFVTPESKRSFVGPREVQEATDKRIDSDQSVKVILDHIMITIKDDMATLTSNCDYIVSDIDANKNISINQRTLFLKYHGKWLYINSYFSLPSSHLDFRDSETYIDEVKSNINNKGSSL